MLREIYMESMADVRQLRMKIQHDWICVYAAVGASGGWLGKWRNSGTRSLRGDVWISS